MAWIVAVLAIISLVAGGFLGTFRHRAYGVLSLAGVLIAITMANIVGASIGTWMAASIGTTEIRPVLVVVQTSMLVIVSLIISYYASDLLPAQHDPKTRADNLMAGSLGVFNAYLIVAMVLTYMQGLNNDFVRVVFGDGQGFNFNRLFIDALPWLASLMVLYIVGWSSVRKFKQAWAKLRGTDTTTANAPASSSSATTSNTSYGGGYQSTQSGYSSTFATPASVPAPTPTPESSEKKGWLAGISGWLNRDKSAESDTPAANAATVTQPTTGYQAPTYQGTSGATPPYGIATSNTVSGSNYSAGYSAPTSSSSYAPASTGYTASVPTTSTGYSSGYNATPPASSSFSTGSTGYSSTYSAPASTSYTAPNPTTSSYSPASPSYSGSTTNYSSGYTAPTSPTPGYSTGYTPTTPSSPSGFGTYNPSVTSGFNPSAPANPASSTDAAVGGMVAGGLFASSFSNQPLGGGFADTYQDGEEDYGYEDEDDEDDDQNNYPSSYRG